MLIIARLYEKTLERVALGRLSSGDGWPVELSPVLRQFPHDARFSVGESLALLRGPVVGDDWYPPSVPADRGLPREGNWAHLRWDWYSGPCAVRLRRVLRGPAVASGVERATRRAKGAGLYTA